MSRARHTVHVTSPDGTRIGATVTGEGRPLVICHGSINTAAHWRGFADAMAPFMTVYAADRRGRGESGDGAAYAFRREVEDIEAVLDVAGPDAVLLGHSFGGLVALAVALARPLPALVLYEPPAPLAGPVGGEAIARYDAAIARGDHYEALAIGSAEFVRFPRVRGDLLRTVPGFAERAAIAPTWSREIRATDAFGADLARFAAITAPTLMVTGLRSPAWLVSGSKTIHRSIPNSRLIEIPDDAHDAFATSPRAFAQLVHSFLREHGAA
ncbi:MAG: alpha/beta hydrolase [Microbacterium sp.]|uniref:alpha/beta fold hydrolase n=1 Tax=Microbacterium sp. TaxID=51671 RepID=UPI000DB2393A|nr:alpha/beta hydrolase [Microbacterium sp.]PZU39908.1 MAG: alpha/beta hydrolase [Microbacterium sp.]